MIQGILIDGKTKIVLFRDGTHTTFPASIPDAEILKSFASASAPAPAPAPAPRVQPPVPAKKITHKKGPCK